ncbi:MAG: hypothetical protein DMF89_07200 [Acidobacteria bacterium]|nr:MAG: hypothetical protein DMF89_07200 [Acidobacteriota bacterium]
MGIVLDPQRHSVPSNVLLDAPARRARHRLVELDVRNELRGSFLWKVITISMLASTMVLLSNR